MNLLDYPLMEKIYKDYKLIGGKEGLNIRQFVKVMLNYLVKPGQDDHFQKDVDRKRKKDETLVPLVRNLTELFNQIDVNDDKLLEWVEFTNHIIELGMVRKDRVFIDAIKNYNISPIQGGKHDTEIEQMFFLAPLKHLLVMERDEKRFKVYNSRTGKFMMNVPARQTG